MIRIANLDDIEDIYALNTELFKVLTELKESLFNPIGFPKGYISVMIRSDNSDYVVIEDDDKIVGYLLIEKRAAPIDRYDSFKKDEFAYIEEIIILPEYRAKGYGTKLIEFATKWAKDRDLTSLELNVLSNNYSAIAFYENNGFEEYQLKLRKEI